MAERPHREASGLAPLMRAGQTGGEALCRRDTAFVAHEVEHLRPGGVELHVDHLRTAARWRSSTSATPRSSIQPGLESAPTRRRARAGPPAARATQRGQLNTWQPRSDSAACEASHRRDWTDIGLPDGLEKAPRVSLVDGIPASATSRRRSTAAATTVVVDRRTPARPQRRGTSQRRTRSSSVVRRPMSGVRDMSACPAVRVTRQALVSCVSCTAKNCWRRGSVRARRPMSAMTWPRRRGTRPGRRQAYGGDVQARAARPTRVMPAQCWHLAPTEGSIGA